MKHGATRGTLTTEATQQLLDAAAARARELDIRVHIAVMDSAADLVGWLSFEGAPRLAATTARHKAFTAVNTEMPTGQWKAYVESIPEDERRMIEGIEGYIAAEGGHPIVEDGILLGGIGISGANQEADEDVARAALAGIGVGIE